MTKRFLHRDHFRLFLHWRVAGIILAACLPVTSAFGLAFAWNGDLRWTGGVVPYVYDANVTSANRAMTEKAMLAWQKAANINFVKQTTQTDYVKISYTFLHNVNFSWVARSGNEQPVWINDWDLRIVTHELGHALGACHEHQRWDRDDYVTVSGYIPGTDVNYFKYDGSGLSFGKVSDNRTPYDYFSIMQYDKKGFNLPWVENVIVPVYATVGDDPTGNPQRPLFNDDSYALIDVIGVNFGANDNGFIDYLSVWDRQGIAGEYGNPGNFSGFIDVDGTTISSTGPAGINVKIDGTGNTVDAVKRLGANTFTIPNSPDILPAGYHFDGLPTGTYVITPSLTGYFFTPRSRTVSISGSGGTNLVTDFVISKFDTDPPTIAFNPGFTNGIRFQTGPSVTGTAFDAGAGVASVRVALNRGSDGVWYDFVAHTWGTSQFSFNNNMAIASGTTSWTYALPSALADGSYSVSVQAVDAQNNGTDPWESRSFIIDNVPPTVTVFVPAVHTPYSTTPKAQGVASDPDDNSPVREVRVALSDSSTGLWWNWVANNWGTANFDFNTNALHATGNSSWEAQLPGLPEGNYRLGVQSVDAANNGSAWAYSDFSIDKTPPTVWFTGFTNQQHIFDFSTLAGSISETGSVTFRITEYNFNGVPDRYWDAYNWVSNNNASVQLPTTMNGLNWAPAGYDPLPTRAQTRQGFYIIDLTGTDVAGNVATTNIVLYRTAPDTTPPLVTLNNILNGAVFTNRSLPGLSGSAWDNESGIASVEVHLYRFSGGTPLYWNGSSWDPNPAVLSVSYNPQTVAWQVNSPLPSGPNLPNGGYGVEIYVLNGESPALNKDLIVNFSVDYHPVYVFNYGSQFGLTPNMNWSDPANWDVGSTPTPDAWVIINGYSPNNTSLGSLQFYRLDLSGGTLTTAGMLLQKLNLSSGNFYGGTITIATNGVCNWSGGNIGGIFNVSSGAVMNVTGAAPKDLADSAVLINQGTINWQGGGLILGNGLNDSSFINNLPGAIFQTTADGPVFGQIYGNHLLVFANTGGLFAKAAGAGTNSVDTCHFINTSVVRCDSGVLAFNAQLDLNAGGTFTGSATNRVAGGTLAVAGLTVVSSSVLELADGQFTGAGDGSGTFGTTGSGKIVWFGGVINGTLTLAVNAHTEISGLGAKTFADSAVLNNDGQVTWLSGTIVANGLNASSFMRNRAGATFTLAGTNAASWNYGNHLGQFENQPGALLVVNTTGESLWDGWQLINNGTLSGVAGRLNLAQGGASTGMVTNIPGAEVAFTGGTFLLHGGTRFTGAGTARIAGATLTADGLATSAGSRFQLDSGALNGIGFTSSGQFYWNGGAIGGTCSNALGGVFIMTGSNDMVLADSAVFNNKGTARLLNARLLANGLNDGATWNNLVGAAFNVASEGGVLGNIYGNHPLFFNNFAGARFAKISGTNSVLDSEVINNQGELGCDTGTLSYATTINLNPGGTFTGAGQHSIVGGTVAWLGTNTLTNTKVSFSGGTITGGSNAALVTTGTSLFDWSGGTIAGTLTLPSGSNIRLSGSSDKVLADSAVFNNAGTALLTGAGRLLANGLNDIATWNNLAGSFFNVVSDGGVLSHIYGNHPLIFNNLAGARFAKISGTSSVLDSEVINNQGELGCDTGILSYATTINLNPGGTFTGTGQHAIIGGVVSWSGTNTLANTMVSFSGGAVVGSLNATVVVAGSSLFDWSGGILYGAMTLQSGSTIRLSGAGDRVLADSAVFNNAGTALFTGAGRLLANGLNDIATWNNLTGSHFNFSSDGSNLSHIYGNHPLIFNNLAGARFAKTAGSNTTVDSTIINNSGELGCDSGTFSFNTTLNLNPGSIFTGAGQHIIVGGTVTWTGTNTVQNSSLNFSNGAVVGILNATVVAAGSSLFDWSGGTLYGAMTLQSGSTMRLSGGGDRVLADSAVFNNAGTALFTGSGRLLANGLNDNSIWNNLTGSHFNFASNGSSLGYIYGNHPLILNNFAGARFAKTAGTNSTVDSTVLNNSGELGCDSGTFTFNTTLNLNPGGTFTGAGLQVLAGGTVTLTGTNTVLSPVLSLAGASLVAGAGATLATAGGSSLDWSGGSLSGTLATLAGSTFRLSGAGNKVMADGAGLNNAGTVVFAGSGPLLANALNAGATITNQTSGVIQIITNATLGRIYGNAQGFLMNSGSIFLSNAPSLFQTDWNYVQSSSGVLGLALAGTNSGTTYSRFAGNSVTLDGSLAINLGGGFVPQPTNAFDVLTFATRTGQFSTTQFPSLPASSHWQFTYNPGSLTLQVLPSNAFQSSSIANGNFQFNFVGQTGSSCLIEVSTNLFNWTPLLTNTPFNGTLNFVDPHTAQFTNRYYRATIFP